MQSGNKDTTHCFICKKKDFENEKSIQEALRNPGDSEYSSQVVTIRPGLHIVTLQTNPEVMPCYKFDIEHAPVGFFFNLSGKLETFLERGRGKRPASIVNQRGINSVICLDGARGYSHSLSDEIGEAAMVYVDPEILTDLIAEELDGIPQESRDLLRQKNSFFSLPMTAEMYNVAARALYHPYQGTAARLHLQGCGLELLALQIDQLSRQDCPGKPLLQADEERIRMVGEILVDKMASPPTIAVLASQVGINSVKLQRGFKQIFGITIGQFLMQQRMICARELLLNRETDVTQAALRVGYSNVSHFIRCYKKTFGVTPIRHKQTRVSRISLTGIK